MTLNKEDFEKAIKLMQEMSLDQLRDLRAKVHREIKLAIEEKDLKGVHN